VKIAAGFGIAALLVATQVRAEHITAYWQLESDRQSGPVEIARGTALLKQRLLPAKLARLTEAATPSGSATPVPAGTLVYLVVNDSGKRGWCTLKNLAGAAKSLLLPVLDRRPCFVDSDGDGRFDASFSVFDIYSRLSPPQPRGDLNSAAPMAQPARYEAVDAHTYPEAMTLTYTLVGSQSAINGVRMQVALDRPGHFDSVDVRSSNKTDVRTLQALGVALRLQSVTAGTVRGDLLVIEPGYISGFTNGTLFLPKLPDAAR